MKDVFEAFKALLVGLRVGDGVKPTDGGWTGAVGTSTFRTYVLVSPGTALTDGPLSDPDSQITATFTTTCVADTQVGCMTLVDTVRNRFAGVRIETAGRVTTGPITLDRRGPIDREDTVGRPVFLAVDFWRVDTVPATSGS